MTIPLHKFKYGSPSSKNQSQVSSTPDPTSLLRPGQDVEEAVPKSRIRVEASSKSALGRSSGSSSDLQGAPSIMPDCPVFGNYMNKGHWLEGKVINDRGDGTYDILYDDVNLRWWVIFACVVVIGWVDWVRLIGNSEQTPHSIVIDLTMKLLGISCWTRMD